MGDTQALAPATEEQAARQAEDLDDPGLLQQRRDEQQQQDGNKVRPGASKGSSNHAAARG